jgi:protein gp37
MIRAAHSVTNKIGWMCVRVSAGCTHCYAAQMNGWRGNGEDYTVPGLGRVTPFLDKKALTLPFRWRSPRRIFVCSMTDLFGEWVPDEWIDRIFGVMVCSPQHVFQILTKRPERMVAYFRDVVNRHEAKMAWIRQEFRRAWSPHESAPPPEEDDRFLWPPDWPMRNVWLGVSVENQATADARIPLLLQTPAAMRFVSYEPALGPADFVNAGAMDQCSYVCDHGQHWPEGHRPERGIDWLIVGCESGPKRRNQDGYEVCARGAIQQAQGARVPVFHKQMPVNGRVSHDPSEWPVDLQVQQWPDEASPVRADVVA